MAYLDWRQENNQWFCYKDNQKIIGWISDDKNKWYHLNNKNGQLDIGWFQTATDNDLWFYGYTEKTEKDGETHYLGECAVNWLEIDGKYYYFYPEKTEENGQTHYQCEMGMGWIESDDKYYYLLTESDVPKGEYKGQMVTGNRTIDGKEYIFNEDGVLQESLSSDLVSENCIDFVKNYEQFYSYKYDDGTGVITQGYGCIGDEIADWGDTITEQQASDRLKELINNNYAKPIKEDLDSKGVTLTQNQVDALYSCGYNIGVSSLLNSSLYRYIVQGGRDASTITADFCMWDKGGGQVMQGLYLRRCAEANMFNNGVYDSTH